MPDTINDRLEDLAIDFDVLGEWDERWQHVMALGRQLDPLEDFERIDANKVRGCAAQVWLITRIDRDRRMQLKGDSDSPMVRGLVAIVLKLYSGQLRDDILAFDAKGAFLKLGLPSAMSSVRANGLASMVDRIRRDAQAA